MKCNSLIHAFCVPVLLAGCSQLDGMVQPETDENRFYIYTEVADQSGVKTTFNPEDLSVEWDDDDRIAVLVKSTDENTWTGYEFIKDEGYNRFYCENFSPEAGKEYEYCLLYPSDDAFTDVDSDGTGNSLILIGNQVQDRTGDASHVETPLFGYAVSSSSESLKVRLMHICTLFEISLENNTDATITVSGMTLSTDNGEKLSGEFFLNFKTGELLPADNVQGKQHLAVTDGSIKSGSSGRFYMTCAPFSLENDADMTLEVRTEPDESYLFDCKVPDGGCEIEAGYVNRIGRALKDVYYTEVSIEPQDWSGDYIITYTSDSQINVFDGYTGTYGTSSTDLASELTEAGIAAGTADEFRTEIRKFGDGYSIYVANVGYIGYTGGGNSLSKNTSGTPDTGSDVWNISLAGGLSPANAPERSLRWNQSSTAHRFACYVSEKTNCLPVTLYRRSVSGTSSEQPDPEPGPEPGEEAPANVNGWLRNLEVPAAPVSLPEDEPYSRTVNEQYSGALAYVCECENDDQLIVTHTFTEGGSRYRNYTLLFDRTRKASLWVAFGMHKSIWDGDSGRHDSWTDDPAIPSSWQSRGCSSPYSRGHQIASNDRQINVTANKQTFYHSNQAPQWQNSFNGGVWSQLENAIQSNAPAGRDTMYVVTGPIFEDGETVTDKEGMEVSLPVAYWKCVMLCSFDTAGKITGAKGIGYYFPGNKAFSGKYGDFATTIDEIEEICGFNLYANIPSEFQDAAESTATVLF